MSWHSLRLRQRLTVLLVGAVAAVVTIITGYFMVSHYRAMVTQIDEQTHLMREQLGQKGMAVAVTVAQASERALAVQDYLFLAQVVQTTKSTDREFVYGALTSMQNIAVVHTEPALAGKVLEGVSDATALQGPTVRETTFAGKPILEAMAPLSLGDTRWGVARFGLSLDDLNAAIAQRQETLSAQLRNDLLTSLAVTLVLVILGIAVGLTSANSLLSPLRKLMEGVQFLREGRMDFTVLASGSPEFVELAQGFNDMTLAVRRRETALEAALSAADEANRYKSEFLANISHELRTPLNAILNVPGALLEDYRSRPSWECPSCKAMFEPNPETWGRTDMHENCPDCGTEMKMSEVVECIGAPAEHKFLNERALKSAQHLLRLVNNLLDFSRLQAGKMDLTLEDVSFDTLLEETFDSVKTLAEVKHMRLVYEPQGKPERIMADRVKLSQILVNLLGNAIKFTENGGVLTVRSWPDYNGDKSRLLVTVQDTGIGIPADKLKMIFEPFRQAEGGHTRAYEGSGLGLAIVKQIVELHGGNVWAESVVGVGSTFFVTLPRDLRPTRTGPPNGHFTLPEKAPRRVVMIDDDGIYLEAGKAVLTRSGFEVEIAREPEKAFDFVRDTHPDFVIMDIMMPRLSGFDVLRRLRADENTRNIPVMVSSGYRANESVARSLGAVWLPKPWHAQDLLDCLMQNNILEIPEPESKTAPDTKEGDK